MLWGAGQGAVGVLHCGMQGALWGAVLGCMQYVALGGTVLVGAGQGALGGTVHSVCGTREGCVVLCRGVALGGAMLQWAGGWQGLL